MALAPAGHRPVPAGISVASVLALQRTAGNVAVTNWLAGATPRRVLARASSTPATAKSAFDKSRQDMYEKLEAFGIEPPEPKPPASLGPGKGEAPDPGAEQGQAAALGQEEGQAPDVTPMAVEPTQHLLAGEEGEAPDPGLEQGQAAALGQEEGQAPDVTPMAVEPTQHLLAGEEGEMPDAAVVVVERPAGDNLQTPFEFLYHFPNALDSYREWLSDDVTWQNRSEQMQEKRVLAKAFVDDVSTILGLCTTTLRRSAQALAAKLGGATPKPIRTPTLGVREPTHQRARQRARTSAKPPVSKLTARQQAFELKRTVGYDSHEMVRMLRDALATVDFHVTEHGPPTRNFHGEYYGNTKTPEAYYTGENERQAIPIVFYKDPESYRAIVLNRGKRGEKRFKYPEGPVVRNRFVHKVQVDPGYRYELGTRLQNTKRIGDDPSARPIQVDINKALVKAGASLKGKDGDHVRDLGFGGQLLATEIPNQPPAVQRMARPVRRQLHYIEAQPGRSQYVDVCDCHH
jgi:hypothetical protein